MSAGLLEQLRIYGEDFDTDMAPVTLDDLERHPASPQPARLLPRRPVDRIPRWVYALVAAAIVLLLVGGAAWLTRSTPPDPVDQPAETTLATETTIASPTTTIASPTTLPESAPTTASAQVWEPIVLPLPESSGDAAGGVRGITPLGDGFVAVGWVDVGNGDDAAIWLSRDGVVWEYADEGLPKGVFSVLTDVVPGGPGLVAAGQACDGPTGECTAAVWTSSDGGAWTRANGVEGSFGDGTFMESIAVAPPGFVAVGNDDEAGAIWVSTDGTAWARVAEDRSVFPVGSVVFRALDTGSGVVAVGRVTSSGGEGFDAAVWTSSDGVTWNRVAHDESVFGGHEGSITYMVDVISTEGVLIAVGTGTGTDGERDAAIWTSGDGVAWTRVSHEDATEDVPVMVSVVAGGPGLVAVGPLLEDGQGGVWTSTDGSIWTRVPHDPEVFDGAFLWDLVAADLGLVAGGNWALEGTLGLPTTWLSLPDEGS